jgi:hypothetical protein
MEVVRTIARNTFVRIIGGVVCLGVVAVILFSLAQARQLFPAGVRSQVISTILAPKGSGYSIDRDSAKYDKSNQLLSFVVDKDGQSLATFTEQPSPNKFTDIPDYSSKFFAQAGEYQVFESINGTVHLLHPGKGIKDAAAMNAKGTLVFVNPSVTFSEDDWRRLFQAIIVVQ